MRIDCGEPLRLLLGRQASVSALAGAGFSDVCYGLKIRPMCYSLTATLQGQLEANRVVGLVLS
ncbi:hypothetical protein WS71_29025 [Burkholderia mayonis]|uniref:Uncharacterized protein n=1 Tax=Burkholderia mayonis TaxID=1385591 RepID=A0A1B4G5F3_9BURK|nr:hypothetical protein WS71_29025 [Burkholderia mayonis]KVE49115.1 hypothetical protein WS71_16995 [Burkholderia mayonis]